MRNAQLIGSKIERLCKEKGVSVSILSAALKCSEYQINSLFEGVCVASFDQLTIIADILEVGIEDIINSNIE